MLSKYLDARSEFCRKRLEQLRLRLTGMAELEKQSDLCIYVTGSYGRFEASEQSDLDVFFLQNDKDSRSSLNGISEIIIKADLIGLVRGLGFPEFTDGGKYLDVH